ncbi:Wzz/FepE/Etk N-terminal domain-containing protein [Solobacterium sp.]|uniref:YveK family protein n=1 Tax=Solobacterium sp. TaxID=2060878 RepID=UPI001CB28CF4|nr:Wzz/FepE/Etk N-terminal domain-containing protein [Solobacterium sp.]MBF1086070.1 hypothetical protein [Solobacterium sp.]
MHEDDIKLKNIDTNIDFNLRNLMINMLQKKIWIIGISIIGLVIGIVYAKFQKIPTYQSDFSVYIATERDDSGNNLSSDDDVTIKVNTAAELLKSGEVLEKVVKQSGMKLDADQFVHGTYIKTIVKSQTQIVDVVVNTENEEMTQLIAETLAKIGPKIVSNLMSSNAEVKVVTSPSRVREVRVSTRSYALKGLILGFGISLLIVIIASIIRYKSVKDSCK